MWTWSGAGVVLPGRAELRGGGAGPGKTGSGAGIDEPGLA